MKPIFYNKLSVCLNLSCEAYWLYDPVFSPVKLVTKVAQYQKHTVASSQQTSFIFFIWL